MTDREAFLKILSMVMDNFSAYHGYDPEWILNTTKTYFEMYQNIFREEENVSSDSPEKTP